MKKSAPKKSFLEELAAHIEKHPDKLKQYDVSIVTAGSDIAAMPTVDALCTDEGQVEDVAPLLLKACVEELK